LVTGDLSSPVSTEMVQVGLLGVHPNFQHKYVIPETKMVHVWYVTSHSGQLSLLALAEREMSTDVAAGKLTVGLESHRPCVDHRLCCISTCGLNDL